MTYTEDNEYRILDDVEDEYGTWRCDDVVGFKHEDGMVYMLIDGHEYRFDPDNAEKLAKELKDEAKAARRDAE